MAYRVLARKWRPQAFDDVVGQEHITDVLKNSIETGRIHHGYLFTGIRGIGKTTTARILAKALNCEHGPTPTPCNACEFCREITDGYSMDVEEIDAASNRGVDDVRVLQENVSYAPSRSRYKIFIIDEVHMLTKEAFNALLKTLEEPPGNVVFIMATTEIWKIPMTILSRCQKFKFKTGASAEIIRLLGKIAAHEQVTISEKSLALLAKTSGGSVRDAETLLDQVISYCGKTVLEGEVRHVLGLPGQRLLNAFLSAILAHRTPHVFALMEQLVSEGHNLRFFCMELMERARNLIILKITQTPDRYLSLFDYTRGDLEQFARMTSLSELRQLYWMLVDAEREMKFSPNPRLMLEMALSRMAQAQELAPLDEMSRRLKQIQAQIAHASPTVAQAREHSPALTAEAHSVSPPAQAFQPSQDAQRVWSDLLEQMKKQRSSLWSRLKNAVPVKLTAHELMIGFHEDAEFSKRTIEQPKDQAFLQEFFQRYFGQPMRLTVTTHNAAPSIEAIQEQHEQRLAALPKPEIQPPPQTARSAPAPAEPRSKEYGENKGGGWQKRSNSPKYRPPIEVSAQDVVRMFDGKIIV